MNQPLITAAELTSSPAGWRIIGVATGWAMTAGLSAFMLTWLVLAWSTVTATVGWQIQQLGDPAAKVALAQTVPTVEADHLVIPVIGVDAPVFYNTDITDAVGRLPDGVVHVRGTAEPGQTGNVFILGHSSGYWWQAGGFTQVFVLLDKLAPQDRIFVNRAGQTYTYAVTSRVVVAPTAVDQLTQPTDRRELSLMTCTPVGTSLNRLIIRAELVTQQGQHYN